MITNLLIAILEKHRVLMQHASDVSRNILRVVVLACVEV